MRLGWTRAFAQLWGSSLFAAAGQGMERTISAWLALALRGDPFDVGLVLAARMLPSFLFGLVAGTTADRHDRRRQLMLVGTLLAAGMAAYALLARAGPLTLVLLMLLSFAIGAIQTFDTPARQALVLDIVSRETALRALALIALVSRFAMALGAAGAGALIAWLDVPAALLACAATFAAGTLALLGLHAPAIQHTVRERPPFRAALLESLRLISDLPRVRLLVAAGIACEIFGFSYMTAVPVFAQQVLAAGPEGLGALNAAAMAGATIAVALLTSSRASRHSAVLLGAVFAGFGLALLGLAASRELWLAGVTILAIGFCAGAYDLLLQLLIQTAVPDAQRGRAVGLWVLSIGSAPVGHLLMGAIAAAIGVVAALALSGIATVLCALLLMALAPEFRAGARQPRG